MNRLTDRIRNVVNKRPAAKTDDDDAEGGESASGTENPTTSSMKAVMKTKKTVMKTCMKKSMTTTNASDNTYCDLAFVSQETLPPRYFGCVTIYTSKAAQMWRLKPGHGRRDELCSKFGNDIKTKKSQWAKLAKTARDMDKDPGKYEAQARYR